MSSRIARAIMSMAVAVGIAPLGAGAIGSAVAQPSAAQFAALECLTNRDQSPDLGDELAARRAARAPRSCSRDGSVGHHVLPHKSCPSASPPVS